jgi:hypothetical protein
VRTVAWTALITLLPQVAPAASQVDGSVDINFQMGRLLATGTYAIPENSNTSGLDAEMLARRNGLEYLGQVLSESCSADAFNPDWKGLVRSVGSEIYSDRTFRILLASNLKDILPGLRASDREILLTDGKPPVFRIITTVPFSATSCGRTKLLLPNGESLNVVPIRKKMGKNEAPVITLRFNTNEGALEGSNEKDKAQLSQSNLFEYAKGQGTAGAEPTALPIVN